MDRPTQTYLVAVIAVVDQSLDTALGSSDSSFLSLQG